MNDSKTFLLVEATNIYDNLYDTNQLSVIRGGSFLLKDAITEIAKLPKFCGLSSISIGASSGLFILSAAADTNAVASEIKKYLQTNKYYRCLTFAIEVCRADDLLQAKAKLLGKVRLRQLQSLTIAPELVHGLSTGPSELGGVRPMSAKSGAIPYSTEHTKMAESELLCWHYGREKKQGYDLEAEEETMAAVATLPMEPGENTSYRQLLRAIQCKSYGFTRTLEEISASPNPSAYGNLDAKIAIFYADGNSFSQIQREEIAAKKEGVQKESPASGNTLTAQIDRQRLLDQRLRAYRSLFLAKLLHAITENHQGIFPDMLTESVDNDGKPQTAIRFETLLWGGDEILFVMPSWVGFAFVQYFFEHTKNWQTPAGTPLHHAAGLVFCHVKTPIRTSSTLAATVAEHVKDRLGSDKIKTSGWDYMVLESLDYPPNTTDLSPYLQARYRDAATHRPTHIPAYEAFVENRQRIAQWLQETLPTRQLYQIARLLTSDDPAVKTYLAAQAGELQHGWPPEPVPTVADDQTADDQAAHHQAHVVPEAEWRLYQISEDRAALTACLTAMAGLFGLDLHHPQQRAWLWLHLVELKDYIAPNPTEATEKPA